MPDNNKKIDQLYMNKKFNQTLAKRTQDNIDNLYKTTFYTDNKDKQYLDNIRTTMDRTLSGLIDKTKMRAGSFNLSELYARTLAKDDQSMSIMKNLTDSAMLSDILELYSNNMVIRDMDREIDVILKYVPRLKQGLDLIKRSVLVSETMNPNATKVKIISSYNKDNGNDKPSAEETKSLELNIKNIEKKYDWNRFMEDLYDKTAKYGEQFVYILPFNKAFEQVMKNKEGAANGTLTEEAILEDVQEHTRHLKLRYSVLNESVIDMDTLSASDIAAENASKIPSEELEIEFNSSGYIPSIIAQETKLRRFLEEGMFPINEVAIKTDYGLAKDSSILKNVEKEFKKFSNDSLKAPSDMTASDGFVSNNRQPKYDVPGCILEMLKHEYVKPLYIGKTCVGYYYIESDRPMDYDAQTTFTSTLGGLRPRRSTRDRENLDRSYMDNAILRRIAKSISDKIDSKFINANQDLAEEMYTILKYNSEHNGNKVSKVRISYIPAEDIIHSYFKKHEHTHRGISDLEMSLFPAKLYSCLYISNCIALLTRGYDKRVYHVRQTVDTNIKAVLLNVINQIKMSNFNLRQIENMNNILNITGRFNDLVVPQGADGQSPVNMEVLPGQNIDIKTEFMRNLEEQAIELLGVSMEMINNHFQSEQSATNIVQNNERFLVFITKRQELYSQILEEIFFKIYKSEYGVEEIINVELPVPNQLRLQSISQVISVSNDIVQNVVNMLAQSDDDFQKAIFTGKLMEHYFGTYLKMDEIMEIYNQSKMEAIIKSDEKDQAQMGGNGMGNQGGYGGGY